MCITLVLSTMADSLTDQIAAAAAKVDAMQTYHQQLKGDIFSAAEEVERLKKEREEIESKLHEAKEKLQQLEEKQNETVGILSAGDYHWVMLQLSFLGRLLKSPDTIDQLVQLEETEETTKLLDVAIETRLDTDCGVLGLKYKITLKTANKGVLALIRKHIRVDGESEYDEKPTPSLRTYWYGNWDYFTHVHFSEEVCNYKDTE